MKLKKSKVQVKLPIEGFRLAHLKPNFNYKVDESVDLFYYVFTKLLKARTFKDGELNLAPFAARSIGPNWFTQSRLKENDTAQRIVDEHLANYLAVQVIPCAFPQYKAYQFRVFLHSPHFMARQMGFSQAIPAPYSMDLEKQICQFVPNSSKEIKQFMSDNLLTRTFYDPIDCEPSGFVTRGFIKWWDAYYKQYNRSLDDIVEGATQKINQIKEAEEAAEKEKKEKEKEAEKEKTEGASKEVQTEKKTKKRKSESLKMTSKRANQIQKRQLELLMSESNPSGMNLKLTSISERTLPLESVHSTSGSSSKEVSSQSKESTNSKKTKQNVSNTEREEALVNPELIIPNPVQAQKQSQNQEKAQSTQSSEGYSRSPTPVDIETAHAENVDKTSNLETTKLSSLPPIEVFLKVVSSTPYVPIRPGTNRGIPIDPRVQFQERLEEAQAENVKKVKQSVRPLPSIPVIDIEADDDLEDLLKVISETKAGSEHVVSNSENKSVQQSIQPQIQQPSQPEKEDSSIQQATNASMQKTILRSAAKKMIQLIDQPLETLQKDAYWNNELVVFTSCLVEKQFPDAYQEKIRCFPKIFENLFHSRENLSNLRLKAALIKENCEALATAETNLKEKNVLYEMLYTRSI
ncbi:hypothetical protein PIB30_025352 [Stylosanthes scabra]|uniref:Uncharacterized protein n=1 Tax=Stylosanthes scabra TaxID=79078 RepID=A0ABU6YA69_9FABA|nr:hypothetical protein [Stylosanthes scabra]